MKTVRMWQSNLESALEIAIRERSREEKEEHGPNFRSSLVGGWKEVLEACKRGDKVVIRT